MAAVSSNEEKKEMKNEDLLACTPRKTMFLIKKLTSGAIMGNINSNDEMNDEMKKKEEEKIASIIPSKSQLSPKIKRLVEWNVDVLKRLLKLIIAKRIAGGQYRSSKFPGTKCAVHFEYPPITLLSDICHPSKSFSSTLLASIASCGLVKSKKVKRGFATVKINFKRKASKAGKIQYATGFAQSSP